MAKIKIKVWGLNYNTSSFIFIFFKLMYAGFECKFSKEHGSQDLKFHGYSPSHRLIVYFQISLSNSIARFQQCIVVIVS